LIYHLDEIEEILVDSKPTFTEVTEELSTTDFGEIFGSIVEPPHYDKLEISMVCLQDLVRFVKIQGNAYQKLRDITVPYLVCRSAFVLRRFILDESLINKAPIPSLRRIELLCLLRGLCDIIDEYPDPENVDATSITFKNILLLAPLVLRAIPISHKVDGLQDRVLKMSLVFTKIISQ